MLVAGHHHSMCCSPKYLFLSFSVFCCVVVAGNFEREENQIHEPAQHQKETESHTQRRKLAMSFFALMISIVALLTICYIFLHQPVKDSVPEHYAQYVHNVKQRYKTHLRDVAQSFWLPADMDTFIQLSLTSQNKPCTPKVDEDSANTRIVSERSMSFNDLLSEIDASPGSRIIVRGQPGIGKTTLLQ